jgi:hypothetical protein
MWSGYCWFQGHFEPIAQFGVGPTPTQGDREAYSRPCEYDSVAPILVPAHPASACPDRSSIPDTVDMEDAFGPPTFNPFRNFGPEDGRI